MRTDKDLLVKGLKRLGFTVILMFTAPIILWQAFKNDDKPLFWPVCIIGIVLAAYAVFMGFKGIKTIVDSVFGKKAKTN